jgi:hypothetical protein
MNSIEEKLWNYIDGSCNADEHKAISLLIKQDELYRQKYTELLKLNDEISTIELDEPPMAFTYNVMETIRAEHAKQPLKAAIDKRVIWGIGLFFVFTISIILIFVLVSINWTAGTASAQVPAKLALPEFKNFLTGSFIKGFLFLDVVLILYLLDTWLRKKSLANTRINMQTTIAPNQMDN